MKISTVHILSNRKASAIFFYGLACSYSILLLLFTAITELKGMVIVAVLIGLYLFRHSGLILNDAKHHPVAAVSPIVEIVLLFVLFFRNSTEIESIVFVIFVADLLLNYKSWYAIPFAYAGFLFYTFSWPSEGIDLWQHLLNILSYTLLVLPIWSTKLLLNQRDINLRLNEALIQEARAREEIAALKERTRIAEDVHDTVGHTLTTAIIALEGAQVLFNHKPEEAYRKIVVAREQLKQGLGNIRQVVRTLKAMDGAVGDLGLEQAIRKIITDTENQTDVQLHLRFDGAITLISLQEYVIFNVIKESITNALRHGAASIIEISVTGQQDTIYVIVKDNGIGSDAVSFGFGLHAIEERVQAIGGQLSVQSEPDKGFTLQVRMPIARGEDNG